jgi:cell division protein FtsN
MKAIVYTSWSIFLILFFAGCSSSEESTNKEAEDSTYVFDEMPESEIITIDTPETNNANLVYVIQIGAFTTEDKASTFAEQSSIKISYKLKVTYNQKVNLFVVNLDPAYKSKVEAESVRNKLWQMDGFQDAWIVTMKSK